MTARVIDREGYPKGVRPCELTPGDVIGRPYRDAKTGKGVVRECEDRGGYVVVRWQRITPDGKATGPIERASYSAANMPTVHGRIG